MATLEEAKTRLDLIIGKGRVDLYKPIQIAEVLRYSRLNGGIDIESVDTYKNASLKWRNTVTKQLLGKSSTSSAQFQHNVWNENAMPPQLLTVLDEENKRTGGLVERYIYMRFGERQDVVTSVIAAVGSAKAESFHVASLLDLFVRNKGIKRSVDKAFEIVAYSLFETVIEGLDAMVSVHVPDANKEMLREFSELAQALLGVTPEKGQWTQPAHLYRVGVTNAADRGLDMWANFGPAVQVKHLTLDINAVSEIVSKIEADRIVIVCRSAEAQVIETVLHQIEWGRRVRGIVTETMLADWYERCLRGKYADRLAQPLLTRLVDGFKAEFPHASGELLKLLEERNYTKMETFPPWLTASDALVIEQN